MIVIRQIKILPKTTLYQFIAEREEKNTPKKNIKINILYKMIYEANKKNIV